MRAIIPAMTGSAWFALDALSVQEVIGERPWVLVPFAAHRTPGVLSWRGRAVAVLDVSELLEGGEPLRAGSTRARTLVVLAATCTLAIPVDLVREVHEVSPNQVRPAGEGARHCAEEVSLLEGVMPVLDLAAIVESVLREEAVAS
jgi:chemotaxis signal transduction protein